MSKKLKELLAPILTKKELDLMPTSFDVVGDILLFTDLPKELEKKEQKIGNLILDDYKNIKVIAKKTKQFSGTFRLPKTKIIAGEKRKQTIHKENNVNLTLHIEKVYFSPRSGNERARISSLVKKNENILVMFSGAGPYTTTLAKNSKARKITGIEINPEGHKYALFNTEKNKVAEKIELKNGDVTTVLKNSRKKFDRIVMPLPKTAEEFFSLALKHTKVGGIIHLYHFAHKGEFKEIISQLKSEAKIRKKTIRILRQVPCGNYSPGVFRVCTDILVK